MADGDKDVMPKAWLEQLDIKPGDHVIAIITNEDEAELLAQFMAQSVEHGAPCSVIAASDKLPTLRDAASREGVDVADAEGSAKLQFVDPIPVGMKGDRFDIELFLQRMSEALEKAREDGVEHSGSMDWLAQVTDDMDDAVVLEARLNELYQAHPVSGL